MVTGTSGPIKRAIVQKLRASGPLVAAIAGGIHESIAPRKVKYPFLVYQLVAANYTYQWDGMQNHVLCDITTWAENPVDANNVDALVAAALNEAALAVAGQVTLLCRRISDTPTGQEIDSTGKRVYQIGGSYEIWTDQSL